MQGFAVKRAAHCQVRVWDTRDPAAPERQTFAHSDLSPESAATQRLLKRGDLPSVCRNARHLSWRSHSRPRPPRRARTSLVSSQ